MHINCGIKVADTYIKQAAAAALHCCVPVASMHENQGWMAAAHRSLPQKQRLQLELR